MTTATTKMPPAPTWDLESIFPGGSGSKEYAEFRQKVRDDIERVWKLIHSVPEQLDDSSVGAWIDAVLAFQALGEDTELVMSFAHCLTSQNVRDTTAHGIESEGDTLASEWRKMYTQLQALSLKQSEDAWNRLAESDKLKGISFFLKELRQLAREKMDPALESLALDLSVSGYHAWNKLYDKIAGDLTVEFNEHGETKSLSLGQLATKMGDADRAIRKQAFEKLEEAWSTRDDYAAMILNSLSGFRLSLYKRRGWDNPVYEGLLMNRLSQASLDAMWATVASEKARLQKYIDAKMKVLGIDTNTWYDKFAPCGDVERKYSYDDAARFIIDNERDFSSDMADFAQKAIEKRWIEAEDRGGKAGGGYCTTLGAHRQSRIFMTYANTYENLLTLAHELGHAYHGHVLKARPYFATDYPMTLAETASIFAELLVTDAALSQSDDPALKLMLLDQKLQQPYTFFCDIHCRYIFETAFYERRKKGVVSKDELNEMMVDAQKKAFAGMLDESGYHPRFWCSKLHFYISDMPFYNFPYTFGFLFATGVYDRARKEGSAFAEKYRALLADTGSMSTEQVAGKHLGVDLTKDEFWKDAVDRALDDIDEFVALAEKVGK